MTVSRITMRKFTHAEIEAYRTPRGGFSRNSAKKLGVPWPLEKGWRKRITRTDSEHEIDDENEALIRASQRGSYNPDLLVRQFFVCEACHNRQTRTEKLRTLLYVSCDPPTMCDNCVN